MIQDSTRALALQIQSEINNGGLTYNNVADLMGVAVHVLNNEDDRAWGLNCLKYCKDLTEFAIAKGVEVVDMDSLYWDCMKYEAQNQVLDSYFLYLEKNREDRRRFYRPKRKQFMRINLVQSLQDLLDGKIDILSISLPPACGKTTIEKFFITGVMGWYPNEYNLFYSHSGDITRMFYDGILDIITSDEYTWKEIFPDVPLQSTNAKAETINLNKYKPFQNLMTASVGSKNAGKVRASKFLCVDDMIGGIEEALNKNILDKLWEKYSVDARQRKVDGCRELIISTRWSVNDHIGRLQRIYEGDDRCRFIAVPDINPETGESNFDFDYDGFSVEFFNDIAKTMDEVSYKCLYKNQPIEREGLLYHDDDLRRYASMPLQEADAVLAICDTKTTGIDYMVVPIFEQYGDDYYMVDCICDSNTDFDIQINRICDKVIEHGIQKIEFESNAGGSRLAYDVDKRLKEREYTFCNVTSKATESNKETRIIVNSEWVKRQCLFKYRQDYDVKSDYGVFMDFLLSYSVAGKNKHDDVPDALANFRLFVENMYMRHESRIIKGGLF